MFNLSTEKCLGIYIILAVATYFFLYFIHTFNFTSSGTLCQQKDAFGKSALKKAQSFRILNLDVSNLTGLGEERNNYF